MTDDDLLMVQARAEIKRLNDLVDGLRETLARRDREAVKAVLEGWLSSVVRPVVIEGILTDLGYPKVCLVAADD